MKKPWFFFGLLLLPLMLAGCGSVLSKDALLSVNYEVDYAGVKSAPDRYQGKTLILGGMILKNEVSDAGSTLEILKYTLDKRDQPQDPDEVNGRFLATSNRLLDPSIYKAGRLVTLTGTLRSMDVRPLQKANYHYPVFEIGELHLWPEVRENLRSPYYYPYYYDPFPYWHRYPYWW